MFLGPLLLGFWSFRADRSMCEWADIMCEYEATLQDLNQAVRQVQEKEPDTRILSVGKRYRAMDIKTAKIGGPVAGNTYSFERPEQAWKTGPVTRATIEGVTPSDMLQILALAAEVAAVTNGHGFTVAVENGDVTVSSVPTRSYGTTMVFRYTNEAWTVASTGGHGEGWRNMSFFEGCIDWGWQSQLYAAISAFAIVLLIYVPLRSYRLFRLRQPLEADESVLVKRRLWLLRSVAVLLAMMVCLEAAGTALARPDLSLSTRGAAYGFFEAYAFESMLSGLVIVALCFTESLILDLMLSRKTIHSA
jgi:hypothetical protein